MYNFLQRLFLGSAGGFIAFVGYEIIILILAWMGKVGPDWLIGIALLVHLMVAFALFLNLAPILGVSIGGYAGGAAPQTADTAGQGATGALGWYIRATQGILHAVTILILSLFLFDYGFSLGVFLFVGILLLAWGQYALVFPRQSRWPQRISTAILLAVTLGAVTVSLSPDVAKFLTGRPFWSSAVYKDAAIAERKQFKNAETRQRAAIARVDAAIDFHKIETGEDWKFGKLVEAGKLTQEEVNIYLAARDGKFDTIPGLVTNGIPAATSAAPGPEESLLGRTAERIGKAIDPRKPIRVSYTLFFGSTKEVYVPKGKWEVRVIPNGPSHYRYACKDARGTVISNGGADMLRSPSGVIRAQGAKHGETFTSTGGTVSIYNDNPTATIDGCQVIRPPEVTIELLPKLGNPLSSLW